MLEISNQNTKVQSPHFKANGGQVQTAPPMPLPPMSPDTFELMQTKKKADSKDKWMKAGVIAGIGCAAAFGIQAILALASHKVNKKVLKASAEAANKQGKYFEQLAAKETKRSKDAVKKAAESLEKEFVDLSAEKGIVSLDDPSIDKNFRAWAKDVVAGKAMPEEVKKLFGGEASDNMIYLYGGSGTGKTYNADVLLKALGALRVKRQFSSFSSKYVGETSVQITQFFENLKFLLEKHPEKKFGVTLDEFETLAVNIEKIGENGEHLKQNRTALLNGLDSVRKFKNLFIVASSNVGPKHSSIDGAIARRFGKNMEIGYPGEEALNASLKTHLKRIEDTLLNKEGYNFYDAEKDNLKKFIKEVYTRHGGHGDIESIAESAINKAQVSLLNELVAKGAIKQTKTGAYETVNQELISKITKEFKFKTKYLEKALKEKGELAGEMGNAFT